VSKVIPLLVLVPSSQVADSRLGVGRGIVAYG
jgi:hypothetical protein